VQCPACAFEQAAMQASHISCLWSCAMDRLDHKYEPTKQQCSRHELAPGAFQRIAVYQAGHSVLPTVFSLSSWHDRYVSPVCTATMYRHSRTASCQVLELAFTSSCCITVIPRFLLPLQHCHSDTAILYCHSRTAYCQVLELAFRIYMGQKCFHDAMRVALRLNEMPLIEQSFGELFWGGCLGSREPRERGGAGRGGKGGDLYSVLHSVRCCTACGWRCD
jgi:hypothetical protein